MNADDISRLVQKELQKGEVVNNNHGITAANLKQFLVSPFAVTVDPDDLETTPRLMWVVLQELKDPKQGYVIVYDAHNSTWGVAEHQKSGFVLIVSADSFIIALDSM